jgi:hypothetical protein
MTEANASIGAMKDDARRTSAVRYGSPGCCCCDFGSCLNTVRKQNLAFGCDDRPTALGPHRVEDPKRHHPQILRFDNCYVSPRPGTEQKQISFLSRTRSSFDVPRKNRSSKQSPELFFMNHRRRPRAVKA